MDIDVDDEPDDEEEETPPPPKLAAAADGLLALATDTRHRHPEVSHGDRLVDVLTVIGRLHELCLTEAGRFMPDPEPRDDDEREWAAERDLGFVHRCADELAELAAGCVRFSLTLFIDLRPEWEEPADAGRSAVAEARDELLGELGILAQPRGRPRQTSSSKDDVADFVRSTLLFAALACADAAHELTHQRLPGTAGTTMLGLAASVLTDGDEIAMATGYESWPGIGDDDW